MKADLIEKRRQELLKQGYNTRIVEIALDWAKGSAEGMAKYYIGEGNGLEALSERMLPRYLKDCETWIKKMTT